MLTDNELERISAEDEQTLTSKDQHPVHTRQPLMYGPLGPGAGRCLSDIPAAVCRERGLRRHLSHAQAEPARPRTSPLSSDKKKLTRRSQPKRTLRNSARGCGPVFHRRSLTMRRSRLPHLSHREIGTPPTTETQRETRLNLTDGSRLTKGPPRGPRVPQKTSRRSSRRRHASTLPGATGSQRCTVRNRRLLSAHVQLGAYLKRQSYHVSSKSDTYQPYLHPKQAPSI